MDDLLTRGVVNIIPNKEELEKLLSSGKKLNVYLGIDATATKIHLGHGLVLRKLNEFTKQGHNVTFLIGDFTALVGDTSDKESERPILTNEEIKQNFETYKKQAEKIIDFSKITVRNNSEWLSKLTYEDILKLKQQFSVNDFISRELIRKRLDEGKTIRLDETEYPIMQGFDSYFMDTDIQIGGADQIFNMQAGRTLQKKLRNKESYILSCDYLMGTDGRKMSKSWGNAIWLTDEPFEMYRKVMAINDDLIRDYFTLATDSNEIPSEDEVKSNPILWKKKLANIIVSELHSKVDADKAGDEFQRIVQNKEIPTDLPELEIKEDTVIDEEFLVANGFAESKSGAKRLFEQNGVTLNEEKIRSGEGFAGESDETIVLRIGKKMVKLKVS